MFQLDRCVTTRARFDGLRIMRALAALLPIAAMAAGNAPAPTPAPPADSGPVPHIEVANETLDLGQVGKGTFAEGSFKLRNTGAAELKILRAQPG